eukprot:scaffold2915_cov181-Amphora_coffeaeformis.AAC.4
MGARKSSIIVLLSSSKLTLALLCILALLYANLRLISRANQDGVLPTQDSNLLHDLELFFHQGSSQGRRQRDKKKKKAARSKDDDDSSYSACLLIMDDNHRLPEWLAYHYFALNLRYLVVAVDPGSRTTPSSILDRFRRRMKIVEWSDRHFTTMRLHRRENASEEWITAQHRTRQWLFYTSCTRHLKQHNRRWTAFIDTDEFITINEALIPDAQQRIHQPGSVVRLLEELRKDVNGTIPNSDFYRQNRTCYTIPRRLYSAVESSHEEVTRNVTAGFDPMHFDTLRYRFRASNPTERNGYCKSLVDVSSVPDKLLRAESWKQRALKELGGPDDEIRPWLDGFVKFVGQSEATYLLQGAGVLARKRTEKQKRRRGATRDDHLKNEIRRVWQIVPDSSLLVRDSRNVVWIVKRVRCTISNAMWRCIECTRVG